MSAIQWLANRPIIFDALRWTLEGGYVGHRRLINRHLRPAQTATTSAALGQDWAVLDIGCGTGIYAQHFSADQYLGIDLSEVYVSAAAAKFPAHRFHVMDARKTALPDGKFSAAFISGVLHHLSDEDAHQVLAEALRVLRIGGRLVVWEDIPAPWWNVVGHVIHRLDLGANIRTPNGYLSLVQAARDKVSSANGSPTDCGSFPSEIDVYQMRSGFMDYAVYVCER